MPETSGINAGGGIQNVGSELPYEVQYESYRVSSKHNAIKLHIGEVIHGTIIEVVSEKEAIVRLPIGTLSAELKGRLKKGDSLFFRVEELEPVLILKIHSVSVKIDGKELSVAEIIRILNLQNSSFVRTVIDFLKIRNNTIQRNEVILLKNNFIKIKNSIDKNLTLNNLLESLYIILKSKIKINENIFLKIQPFFLNIKYFNNDFLKLFSSLSLLPEQFAKQLTALSNKLLNKNISVKEKFHLLNSLKLEIPNQNNLYSLLNNIVEYFHDKQRTNELKNLIKSIENMQAFLESKAINNFFLLNLRNQFYVILPYLQETKIVFNKILISSPLLKTGQAKKINFSFEIITDNLDEILVKGDSYEQQLNAGLYVKTDDIKNYLSKELGVLKQQLANDSFMVRSLIVTNINDKDISGLDNKKLNGDKGFSVVI